MTEITHEKLLESLFDGVYYVDMNRKITFWNNAAERITGFKKEDVKGVCCSDNILRHIDKYGSELCVKDCPLAATLDDGKTREAQMYLHHKDGHRVPVTARITPVRDDKGDIIGGIEIFSDNSDRILLLQEVEHLKQEVYIDKLTGIGNRRYAEQIINTKLYEMQTYKVPFGLIFLDVDHFKNFNDKYGHNTGDAVLTMVAKTVGNIMRKLDSVCRWGGEEFLVILANTDIDTLKKVSERIRAFIEKSFITEGDHKLAVTASLGATISKENDTLESIVERADTLMYQSKQNGRNRLTTG